MYGGIVNALNRIVTVIDEKFSSFVDNETPAGAINGANAEFSLVSAPDPAGSLQVFLNGMLQTAGGEDYTLSGNIITFGVAPYASSVLRVFYRY